MRNPFFPLPTLLPLHPAQRELQPYRLTAGHEQSIGGRVSLSGPLNVEALHRAVAHLPLLFDVFRWQFDPTQPEATATIVPQYQALELPCTDVSTAPDPQHEADVLLRRQDDVPIAGAQHPFFTIQLLRLSALEHQLLVRGHRLLLDDAGFDVLLTGIAESYGRAVSGEKLPEPARSYAREVEAARFYVNSVAYADDQAHWRKQLPNRPTPLLRTYRQTAPAPKTYTLSGSGRLSRILKQTADRLNEPPTHLLMAALTIYFSRVNQQDHCVFGRVVAGRQTRAQLSVAGRFDRVLPIRIRHQPSQSLRLLLQTIRRQHRSDNSRRQYPMSHVAAGFHTSSQHLFDVLVQHQSAPPQLNLPGLESRVQRLASAGADVSLHLCWQEGNGQQPGTLRVSGRSACVGEGDVRSILVQVEHLLQAFSRCPDAPLASFDVLPRFVSEYLSQRSARRSVRPLLCY